VKTVNNINRFIVLFTTTEKYVTQEAQLPQKNHATLCTVADFLKLLSHRDVFQVARRLDAATG